MEIAILENKFHRVMIDDIELESEPWLIEGMVCPWLTLLSGQPKHGKTILAGHIATALINQEKPWQMCGHGLQHIPPGIPLQ